MFAPHAMMYFECRNCSGSVPSFHPVSEMSASPPALEQMVRSSCEAAVIQCAESASVGIGQDGFGPVLIGDGAEL
jgi:hypothetical protein